jgi:ankyrin repeat protein
MDGNVGRMRWLHFAGAKVGTRTKLGSPLFLAANAGKLRAVRYLLDEGADVNCREAGGSSPVIEAAYNGHVEIIKELLLRGAEVNAISDYGTALDVAISRKNTATAEVLRHLGAKTASEIRASK